MSPGEVEPAQALQSCLDSLLSDIQAQVLWPADRASVSQLVPSHDPLASLFSRLAAAGRFLSRRHCAVPCRDLCRDWQVLGSTTSIQRDRQILLGLARCRESWQARTADEVLRSLLLDHVRAAIDAMVVAPDDKKNGQGWLQRTRADCNALVNAGHFLIDADASSRRQPPPTSRALLRWMLMWQKTLEVSAHKSAGSDDRVPWVFRRELRRCLQCFGRATAVDVVAQNLWQLQLLAGALLALGSMQHRGQSTDCLTWRCKGLMVSAAQAQLHGSGNGEVDQLPVSEALRHALILSSGLVLSRVPAKVTNTAADVGTSTISGPGVDFALVTLPDLVLTPAQALLAVIADAARALVDWAAISLQLYRVLVRLRLLGGGFVDAGFWREGRPALTHWQSLMASLHASVDHCLQGSVVTAEDQGTLLNVLHRTALQVHSGSAPVDTDLLPDVLLTAARLNLRAQHHWQRLTLDLDATQQDFARVSVQQVLANELQCLPHMGVAARRSTPGAQDEVRQNALPQDVLRDLRLLLKGARILNVQRIESLVLVMIEVYAEMQACPAFAGAIDIGKALPRAHRSLCRMLDQAAAWQAPGNARRIINTLYGCLERWRGTHRSATAPWPEAYPPVAAKRPATVNESPAGQVNDPWRRCLIINRRLRKLLRHQDDLDGIRVLLLELLRSQEEIMRRQADHRAVADALPG